MVQHSHSLGVNLGNLCQCGAYLCGVYNPQQGVSCLLEKGHPGDHVNPAVGKVFPLPEVRWPREEEITHS